MKTSIFFFLLLISHEIFSQIEVDSNSFSQPVKNLIDSKINNTSSNESINSILKSDNQEILSELGSLDNKYLSDMDSSNTELIFSKSDWGNFNDSLKFLKNINTPFKKDLQEPIKFVDHEYMELVNTLTSNYNSNEHLQLKVDSVKEEGNQLNKFSTYDSLANSKILLSEDLPILHSNPIENKSKDKYDSIVEKNLRLLKLKPKQKIDSAGNKIVNLKKNKNFKDITYFEGLVSFSEKDLNKLKISPAIGIEFIKDLSVGFGPEFNINTRKDSVKSSIYGARAFLKRDFFKKNAFIQFESGIEELGSVFSESDKFEKDKFFNQKLLLGGGVLIPLYGKYKLNIASYIDLNKLNNKEVRFPINIRIGLSTLE